MYNTMDINPGYTATRGVASILGMYRRQWVGLDGAPKTGSFSAQTPISRKGQGLGIVIVNDQIGPSQETIAKVNYSYPVKISEDVKLSFGVSVSANFIDINFNKLRINDDNDNQLTGTINNFSPNIGAGGYFYSNKWYAGLSVPNFLETKFYDDVKTSLVSEKMHFYMIGGYVFELSYLLKFKPAFMLKAVNGSPLSVDLSANFLFNDKLTLGAAYRLNAAVSCMAGFQVSDAINIGYAYDFDTQKLGRYNSGSHEFFIRFNLFSSSRDRMITPRFF